MRVLVVGAGAVGQVYGRHLQRGGAELTFFVKPKYAEEARAGFTVYPLNEGTEPVGFDGFEVVTTAVEVAAGTWDQVWLSVSSPALKGPWLPELLAAAGEATLIMLQPGLEDRDLLLSHWPEERLVTGLIAFIAYQAPMPGEARFTEPGVAYWFPPMGPSPFGGLDAGRVVDALTAGGCPAVRKTEVARQAAWPSASLNLHVAALESVGWSWDAARQGDTLALASRAAQQAMAVAGAQLGQSVPLGWRLGVRPSMARVLMALAPRVIPLDIETYLGVHFTKVGEQTRQNLGRYIDRGKDLGLEVGALVEMARRVDAARAAA